ncbi:SCAN domain-containing protein 3 [Trichonephila clavipes]|nr:SCAN domain-containing protein 3 [Trichonephila clavipes]
MNETTQQEKTTQLSSRNEQLNSSVGTKQLNSALPSTAYNRLQPPTTTCNHLQPPTTAYNHLQPPTTAYNRLQPPTTTCNRLHRLHRLYSRIGFFYLLWYVSGRTTFCKPIKLKATAIALFDILNNFINEANIEWKNCVGICTDGARTMSGRFKSIQALVKQKSPLCIWTHCMIHREALASKEISPGLNIVLMTVVTVVNYIKIRPLKSRIFSGLCKDMGTVHSSLLFYCEARWLSRGK